MAKNETMTLASCEEKRSGESDLGPTGRVEGIRTPENITNYTQMMTRSLWSTLFVASIFYVFQWIIIAISTLGTESSSAVTIPRPRTSIEGSIAALTAIMTVAIAVQVVLRLQRDVERFTHADVVAHREFWGRVSSVTALAAGFLLVYVLVDGFILTMANNEFDFNRILTLPMGFLAALVFSLDSMTLATQESRLKTVQERRRRDEKDELTAILGQLEANNGTRAKTIATAVSILCLWLTLVILSTLLVKWWLVGSGVTWLFILVSVFLSAIAYAALVAIVPGAARGRLIDVIFVLLALSMLVMVYVLQYTVYSFKFVKDQTDGASYIPVLLSSILLLMPAIVSGLLYMLNFR